MPAPTQSSDSKAAVIATDDDGADYKLVATHATLLVDARKTYRRQASATTRS